MDSEAEAIYALVVAEKARKPWVVEYVFNVLNELGYSGVKVASKSEAAPELRELKKPVHRMKTQLAGFGQAVFWRAKRHVGVLNKYDSEWSDGVFLGTCPAWVLVFSLELELDLFVRMITGLFRRGGGIVS